MVLSLWSEGYKGRLHTLPKGQIHILAGASGAGKTTLLLQAIAANLRGAIPVIPSLFFPTTSVAYIAADRTASEIRTHSDRLCIDPSTIEIYGIVDDRSFAEDWLSDAELCLKRIKDKLTRPFDTLVLDPLGLFIDGSPNDYRKVAISLVRLNRRAAEWDVRIIANHHAVKTRSDFHFKRPQDRISGSQALQGYSGTQMVLIEGSENGLEYDSFTIIPHIGSRAQTFPIARDTNGYFQPYVEDTDSLAKSVAILDLFSPGQSYTVAEIEQIVSHLDLSRRTLYRLLDNLIKDGLLTKPTRGTYVRPQS